MCGVWRVACPRYSDTWDMYNIATSTWTNGKLPSGQGRQYGTAVGCGGKLVFGGGQIAGGQFYRELLYCATVQQCNVSDVDKYM